MSHETSIPASPFAYLSNDKTTRGVALACAIIVVEAFWRIIVFVSATVSDA